MFLVFSSHNLRSILRKVKYFNSEITLKLHTDETKLPLRAIYFGTDSFSASTLKALNESRYWKPPLISNLEVVMKDTKGVKTAVQQYVSKHSINFHIWPNIDAVCDEFDVGIVVSFGHLIPTKIIQRFPLGMLNVHASLLPRWRGADPIANTILNGDDVTGVTIMQIAPHKFDVGKVVLQKSCPVHKRATTAQLKSQLAEMGADLLVECLKDLRKHLANSKDQDESLATKAPKIGRSKARLNFAEQTCDEIDRLHRALSDSIKLETSWHGTTIRLDDIVDPKLMSTVDVLKLVHLKPEPGFVHYHKRRKTLCVLCKDGWVGFLSIYVEKRSKMTASDFYNGFISKVDPQVSIFK